MQFRDEAAQARVQRLVDVRADDLAAGRLTEVLPDWSVPEIWLTLYYPPYERLPLKVATFSDFFETYVRETRPL